MADPTGLGLGAGGGAAAGLAVYLLDRLLGSGRAVKTLDQSFRELREALEADLASIRTLGERANVIAQKLLDWHDVTDPDDPAGKIWYFSVGLRRLLTSMQAGVDKLLQLIGELIQRFDRYNETMLKLITVVERLQTEVSSLSALVNNLDRRR